MKLKEGVQIKRTHAASAPLLLLCSRHGAARTQEDLEPSILGLVGIKQPICRRLPLACVDPLRTVTVVLLCISLKLVFVPTYEVIHGPDRFVHGAVSAAVLEALGKYPLEGSPNSLSDAWPRDMSLLLRWLTILIVSPASGTQHSRPQSAVHQLS